MMMAGHNLSAEENLPDPFGNPIFQPSGSRHHTQGRGGPDQNRHLIFTEIIKQCRRRGKHDAGDQHQPGPAENRNQQILHRDILFLACFPSDFFSAVFFFSPLSDFF